MAVLSDSDRQTAAREWIRKMFEELGATANLDTVQIKAALDAADDWLETVLAAYNLALPVPFRANATVPQKAALLAMVTLKRGGLL